MEQKNNSHKKVVVIIQTSVIDGAETIEQWLNSHEELALLLQHVLFFFEKEKYLKPSIATVARPNRVENLV